VAVARRRGRRPGRRRPRVRRPHGARGPSRVRSVRRHDDRGHRRHLLFLQGGLILLFGSETKDFPQFLPTETFKLAGVHVQYAQLIVVITGLVLAVALYAFFRFSRLGSSMRAVVDSPSLVSLTGTSP
jgi:Branched-chain amino acid ABC-type transport system, permease components